MCNINSSCSTLTFSQLTCAPAPFIVLNSTLLSDVFSHLHYTLLFFSVIFPTLLSPVRSTTTLAALVLSVSLGSLSTLPTTEVLGEDRSMSDVYERTLEEAQEFRWKKLRLTSSMAGQVNCEKPEVSKPNPRIPKLSAEVMNQIFSSLADDNDFGEIHKLSFWFLGPDGSLKVGLITKRFTRLGMQGLCAILRERITKIGKLAPLFLSEVVPTFPFEAPSPQELELFAYFIRDHRVSGKGVRPHVKIRFTDGFQKDILNRYHYRFVDEMR
ncbi:hypothetical protein K461DRAFT_101505 [Myriangium duriaei CBS 260.36]|uniref:Uncharacterized protein n=1 Tax=Myriangium duriaei CBS 260.36 TaxID=1168546 RepID=A0A9P4J7T5_9PEZI|nr:hypothetical protein K461DRAFT_101505 [Myriangium duriaei CBS 260.36]